MKGERKPMPFLEGPSNEGLGQFSPDGRFVVHGSDEAGTPEVYVRSFPDANEKWQISKGNGVDPRWRADGKAFLVNLPVGSNASRPINVLLNWQATLKH